MEDPAKNKKKKKNKGTLKIRGGIHPKGTETADDKQSCEATWAPGAARNPSNLDQDDSWHRRRPPAERVGGAGWGGDRLPDDTRGHPGETVLDSKWVHTGNISNGYFPSLAKGKLLAAGGEVIK